LLLQDRRQSGNGRSNAFLDILKVGPVFGAEPCFSGNEAGQSRIHIQAMAAVFADQFLTEIRSRIGMRFRLAEFNLAIKFILRASM